LSLTANTKTIRDYAATAAKTALLALGPVIYKGEAEQENVSPSAVVRVESIERVPGDSTPTYDAYQLTIGVYVRLSRPATGVVDDWRLEYVSALRTALLESINPGSVGYMPQVDKVDLDYSSPADNLVQFSVVFLCRTSVSRA
jgi:hypothetical protein